MSSLLAAVIGHQTFRCPKRFLVVTVSSLVLVLLMACAPPDAPAPNERTVSQPRPLSSASVDDREGLGETARALAGLTSTAPELEEHSAEMNRLWTTMRDRHLAPLNRWRQEDLGILAEPERPLLYFFGGPDLLNAQAFFPEADSYILIGLEAPGPIPMIDSIAPDKLRPELERIRRALSNMTKAGYFVTHRMADDLVSEELTGIQPLLFVFIARSGFLPTRVDFVSLDDQGDIRPATGDERSAVRLRVRTIDEDQSERTIYYFSRDLSDEGLASDPRFRNFLERQAPFHSYLKSASYLLHLDGFSTARRILLDGAATIVQDDSGIPYRFLNEAEFDLQLHGVFTHTHPAFGEWFQQDLADAFSRDQTTRPLEFAIGYQAKIGGGGLIRADRR